jgi:hypothetical protein
LPRQTSGITRFITHGCQANHQVGDSGSFRDASSAVVSTWVIASTKAGMVASLASAATEYPRDRRVFEVTGLMDASFTSRIVSPSELCSDLAIAELVMVTQSMLPHFILSIVLSESCFLGKLS